MLPLGYIELEYLQSTGTQWIDTGIKGNENTDVNITFNLTSLASPDDRSSATIFGSRYEWNSGIFQLSTFRGGSYARYSDAAVSQYIGISSTNTIYNFYTVNNEAYLNNYRVLLIPSTTSFETPSNILLFALSERGDITEKSLCKIYKAEFSNNGTLARNFIPAKRASDGVLGMYDIVSNQFFTNQGSGTFIGGPIKAIVTSKQSVIKSGARLPVEYQEVEYLANDGSGSAHINTNINSSYNSKVDVEFKMNSIATGLTPNPYIVNGISGLWDINSYTIYFRTQSGQTDVGKISIHGGSNVLISSPNTDDVYRIVTEPNGTSTLGVKAYTNGGLTTSRHVSIKYIGTNNKFWILGTYSNTISNYIQLRYAKIYNSDVLVFNGIPSRRKSDSVLGMYDLVSGNFFTNQGTGSFTAGPDVFPPKVTSIKDIVVKPILPSGYKRLEYIESSGTQYIDTGIIPSTNMKINCKMQYVNIQGRLFYRGIGNYSPLRFYPFYANIEDQAYTCLIGSSATFYSGVDGLKLSILDFEWKSNGEYISSVTQDGQAHNVSSTSNSTFTQSMYLFGLNNNNRLYSDYPTDVNIHSCKLWKSGSLVRSFIPSQRLSDNAIGMYDLVSNTFFTNQGMGSFTAGPEVSNYEKIQSIKTIIRL